jgi:hypothetical protein
MSEIKNLKQGTTKTQEVCLIVKASLRTEFHRWFSPISQPFVREVFWYKNAFLDLTKLCPEIKLISPGKDTI